MSQVRLHIVPVELTEANEFVARLHRHHKPVVGHRWSLGVADPDGTLRGVAIVGRPVARLTDQKKTVEVTRVCTDGTPNACSALYGAACRTQRAHGFKWAQTFILESESGVSLRAAGWVRVRLTDGGLWDRVNRERRSDPALIGPKELWCCPCWLLCRSTENMDA